MRALVAAAALALLLPLGAALPLPVPLPDAPSLLGPNRPLPIVVAGDAGFELPPDLSGVRGGRGSPLDPYRIEGWTIQGLPTNPTFGNTGYANVWLPCILLQNTQAHVVIRDNFIKGNNCHGIWLQNASNVRIERNTIEHNTGHGIFVESFGPPTLGHFGCFIAIRDNVVKANGFDGIRTFHALFVDVEANQLIANANFGHLARAVEGLEVRGNTADYNGVAGFFVEMSHRALLEGNLARWNPTGLDVEFSDDVVVQDNVALDGRDLGIYTSEASQRTQVLRNRVERNGLQQAAGWDDGIVLNGVDEVARDNVALDNRDGIQLGTTASGTRLERNLVRGGERGIVFQQCPGAVRDNGVHDNGVGLDFEVPGCGGIAANNIAGNGLGARGGDGAPQDLRGNWWGSPDGPAPIGSGDGVEGAVLVSPWLAAPNPVAPS